MCSLAQVSTEPTHSVYGLMNSPIFTEQVAQPAIAAFKKQELRTRLCSSLVARAEINNDS